VEDSSEPHGCGRHDMSDLGWATTGEQAGYARAWTEAVRPSMPLATSVSIVMPALGAHSHSLTLSLAHVVQPSTTGITISIYHFVTGKAKTPNAHLKLGLCNIKLYAFKPESTAEQRLVHRL